MSKYELKEGKMVKVEEGNENHIFTMYMRGKLSLDELIKKSGGIEEVASKKELEDFIKNKFLVSIQADEYGIKPNVLIDKVNELLKRF